ncbi:MAG: hypothetical protein IJW27_07160 [Clostridia bacterium]|nr:hypothetical protein [Clostridia bacterium]
MQARSTKKALLASLLSLVVCVSMLVGSTFAWFTDSVTSANNIIKSGNLDVTLEWMDGKLDPADTANAWTDASATPIFNYDLWEPGYTEVRHVKIANVGSLALKYSVTIEANGEVTDLADVIDVYYVDPAVQVESRANLPLDKKLGTLSEVLANLTATGYGELEAKTADTVTIALKMQETAGNTYMNKFIGSTFSVKVFATQLTYEKDSFDNQYDYAAGTGFVGGKGTAAEPFLVNEAAQLLNISNFDEYTYFKVADGVETLDMTGVGKIRLNGSFDGNGVTMNNLTTALFEYVGKVGDEQDIKISNLTANVNTTDGRGLVRNIFNPGTTTFENVTLHGYIEGQYNMGSFYNYGTANAGGSEGADYTVNFVNATSDVTLVNTSGNSIGGMLGHGYEGTGYKLYVNMDADSGYTGQMYTTGTATCYKVMAMCSHATYILNGVETSRYDNTYPSTKLVAAKPEAKTDGYYVTPATNVAHYVVSLEAQLSVHDENGVIVPNQAGLTWSLGKKTITGGFDGKIFDLVDTVEIVNDKNKPMGYELTGGALKVYTGSDRNFKTGWFTLIVTQYDANGTILATGNVRVGQIDNP